MQRSVYPTSTKRPTLLELGCGNGRDALYFARNGIRVIACDLSQASIAQLSNEHTQENLTFITADFSDLGNQFDHEKIGVIYSRFTMHAVPADIASATYRWAFDNLETGGLLLIEARTNNDAPYGK